MAAMHQDPERHDDRRRLRTPNREEQALREVGVTTVIRPVALLLTILFLVTICLVIVIQPIAEYRDGEVVAEPFRDLAAGLREAVAEARSDGLLAANRRFLAAMGDFEIRLEESSVLRRNLLPPTQLATTRLLGLGNEQVYVGRDGWLFYRADLDHVTGRGFLDPAVLRRRSRGGDAWEAAPHPDPRPALDRLHRDLGSRGIRLLVVPTPVKPALEADRFSIRAGGTELPLRNPSETEIVARLEAAGIAVFDPAPILAEQRRATGEVQYLITDTHWTPAAADEVARALAEEIGRLVELSPPGEIAWARREAVVTGPGDIAVMLDLPEGQEVYSKQSLAIRQVTTWDGLPWRPDPGAEVLILGDSFTNVYSEPSLGWGSGAGLAEQLTYHLQRPVDRIAQNAGGSHTTREALRRALEGDPGRLSGTRIVVYQFATRELSAGDWRPIALPAVESR